MSSERDKPSTGKLGVSETGDFGALIRLLCELEPHTRPITRGGVAYW